MPDIIPLKTAGPSGRQLSDPELMERIAAGEASGLEQLLHRYWRPLVGYSTTLLPSMDAAEDVVQEVFVRVWERRAGWQAGGSVRAFLYHVARNLALNERRHRRVRLRWRQRVAGSDRQQALPPTRLLELDERRKLVEQAIEDMPERRREVFRLAWFHQLSYQQIAHVLGVSPNTVSNHMTAAHADLRRRLAPVWNDEV